MKSLKELLRNIHNLNKKLSPNPYIRSIPLEESLMKMINLLISKNVNIEEYLFNLWDEPDFQIKVLEDYCSDIIDDSLISIYFAFHYTNTLLICINNLKNTMQENSNFEIAVKKFILDLQWKFNNLIKGIFSKIAYESSDHKNIMDMAIIEIQNFHTFKNIKAIFISQNRDNFHNNSTLFNYCSNIMEKKLIPFSNPLSQIRSANHQIISIEELIDNIDNNSSFLIADALLSSRLITGNLHIYNEIRGIVIERLFDIHKHKLLRKKYIKNAFDILFTNIKKLKNETIIDLELILQTASFYSTLEQIYHQIYRYNFYEIIEKVKVVHRKHNIDPESIFLLENATLFFHFLYTLVNCFMMNSDYKLSDKNTQYLSELFTNLTNHKDNIIKNNISLFYDQFLNSLEIEINSLYSILIKDS